MTALRALVLLLAVSAACVQAGKVSGSVRATSVQRAVNAATKHINSQITDIENYGIVTDAIDEALDKLSELTKQIQEKVEHAEKDLIKAVKKAAEGLTNNLNNVIKKVTGLDLHLDDKLEDLEKKYDGCADELKSKIRAIFLAIKTDAETCAAPQIAEAQRLVLQIRELIDLIEAVPGNTIKNIKKCVRPEPVITTTAEPETTTAAEPETTTAAEPETTTDSEPETTTDAEPEPITADKPDVVVVNFKSRQSSVNGIFDVFEKIKCVTEVLGKAASDLKEAPRLVYYLNKEIRDLTSKETQKTLKKCASQAIAGKSKDLQQNAAELAYCVIAPRA